MSDDGDPCTAVEMNDVSNEACIMDSSKSFTSSKSMSEGTERFFRYVVAISVILFAITLILAASGACVIVALLEISQLKSEVTGLSTLQQGCSGNQIALQIQELLMFQQNISDVMETIATNLDRNSDDLSELLQSTSGNQFALQIQQLLMFQQNMSDVMEMFANNIDHNSDDLSELLQDHSQLHNEHLQLRSRAHCPLYISSCSSLLSYNILYDVCPSDYYIVRTANGTDVRVYCDMGLQCGGVTGGWMRVAETYQDCPSGFVESNENGLHQCRIGENRCFSVNYPTLNVSYSNICETIAAYQVGSTDAFRGTSDPANTIDSNYVDGISLTHGINPRQHIWTFAAALDRTGNSTSSGSYCPCQNTTHPQPDMIVPPFVGEDYFCDAAEDGLQTDPLWTGTDCLCCANRSLSTSSCHSPSLMILR